MLASTTFMASEPVMQVKKLSEFAKLPYRGSKGAAGYDLCRFPSFYTALATVSYLLMDAWWFQPIYPLPFHKGRMAVWRRDLAWQ